jgi:phosphatidylglycerol:prolipoprotein diacylglycerol transferase
MLPELFRIPGLGIPIWTYGLLVAAGFILALLLSAHLAAKDGLPKGRIYDLGLYVFASGLIGAKALMIATEWDELEGNWRRIFSLDFLGSGGVYFGGFLAGLIVAIGLMRMWKLPWLKTADAIAPGLALGHSIGRLGCFSAGCCWGKPTSSWIGVRFTQRAHELTGVPIDSALVPTQIIESAANLIIFGLLMRMRGRRAFDGQVTLAYLLLYSAARFTIEFWRGDPRGQILGLSTSQFISALIFPSALALMVYLWRRSSMARLN